ncbi:gliadoralin-A-like [Mesocricetus auratus]|uniref:Gliadoralin-A-like n=1 Tax=Mesocricetus auratus TaxID=10036 RepID=A0ABM2X9Y2_MESAU|nr:gliadoralin-A-like [Mesocricetus auratus]
MMLVVLLAMALLALTSAQRPSEDFVVSNRFTRERQPSPGNSQGVSADSQTPDPQNTGEYQQTKIRRPPQPSQQLQLQRPAQRPKPPQTPPQQSQQPQLPVQQQGQLPVQQQEQLPVQQQEQLPVQQQEQLPVQQQEQLPVQQQGQLPVQQQRQEPQRNRFPRQAQRA